MSSTSSSERPSGLKALSSAEVGNMLMEFLMYMFRAVVLFYPVYLTGSLGLSISWVLLSLVLWNMWEKNRQWKDRRINTAIDFLDNERRMIEKEMKNLRNPAWIQHTDVEKAVWINKILQHAWPFFGIYMDKLLKETIQESIRQSNVHLKTFTFTKVHFGQRAPTITGVRVYTHEVDKREVILDLNIVYVGDLDITADVKPRITAGLKELQLHGMLRVVLEPLIGQSPLVGGITMFFIRRPTLRINWTGMTNLLDSPALRQFSETTILDIIASIMVLPNRLCFPLVDQVKVDQLRFPLPRGVVRVHVIEGRNLVAMDTVMMGLAKGKSDPYAVLRVGNMRHQTKTIKANLTPHWNEVFEFVVHEAPGQELEVELYDEDTDKDDFMGRFNLDFGEVKKDRNVDKWFELKDVKSGELHFKLQWLSLQTDKELLKEATGGCACAMLAVYLDNASNLPKAQSEFTQQEKPGKQPKEAKVARRQVIPNCYVKFSIDQQEKKSRIVYASSNPVFEECFTFFVHNVEYEKLLIQVLVPEKKTLLGSLNLSLDRLLAVPDLTMDQCFQLERSGANSQIKMKVVLRILKLEKPQPKVEPAPATQKTQSKPPQPQQPQSQSAKQQPPPTQPQPAKQQPQPQSAKQQPQPTQPQPQSAKQQLQPTPQPSAQTPLQSTLPEQSTSSTMPSQTTLSSVDGLQAGYVPHRRGSLKSSESLHSGASTPSRMRRYDSHSLLSDNSIAASRLDLTNGVPYPEALLNHKGGFGDIELSIRHVPLRNKLLVTVNSCRNLFPCGDHGSDTYVRIYLLPDQKWKNRMRTQVRRRTTDPIFMQKFEFSVSLEEAKTRQLDVSVKNNRMFHTRERKEIGMALIDLSGLDLVKGSVEWYELTLPGLKKTN